jgi:hypothetical protein
LNLRFPETSLQDAVMLGSRFLLRRPDTVSSISGNVGM